MRRRVTNAEFTLGTWSLLSLSLHIKKIKRKALAGYVSCMSFIGQPDWQKAWVCCMEVLHHAPRLSRKLGKDRHYAYAGGMSE